MTRPMIAPAAGVALGSRFVLEHRLGRGAMGDVWAATDRRTQERFAVKLLRPELADDPSVIVRFVQERELLTGVCHPRVVRVEDLVVEGGVAAIVTQLIPGGSLRERLNGPVSVALACALLEDVLRGLEAVHASGIVHRDLKPENILIEDTTTGPRALLADFGISRLAASAAMTRLSAVIGSPQYMAPEVVTGAPAGFPADLYGVGIVAYEMLAGGPPFAGDSPLVVMRRNAEETPAPLAKVPAAVQALVSALLSKDPARRPAAGEAAEACHALRASIGVPQQREGLSPATTDAVIPDSTSTRLGRRPPAQSPVEVPRKGRRGKALGSPADGPPTEQPPQQAAKQQQEAAGTRAPATDDDSTATRLGRRAYARPAAPPAAPTKKGHRRVIVALAATAVAALGLGYLGLHGDSTTPQPPTRQPSAAPTVAVVFPPAPVARITGVSLAPIAPLRIGQRTTLRVTLRWSATPRPEQVKAALAAARFSSSAPQVASVVNGTLLARGAGTAKVSERVGGLLASVNVSVLADPAQPTRRTSQTTSPTPAAVRQSPTATCVTIDGNVRCS